MYCLTLLRKPCSKSWMTFIEVHGFHGGGTTPSWVQSEFPNILWSNIDGAITICLRQCSLDGWFSSDGMDDVEKTCIHDSPLSSGGAMWKSRPVGHTRGSSIMNISSSSCIWTMSIQVSRPFECSPRTTPHPHASDIHWNEHWCHRTFIHPWTWRLGLMDDASIIVPAVTGCSSKFPLHMTSILTTGNWARMPYFIPHPHIHPESTHAL